ncbi:MAG: CheR family methyltransferase [Candidatus Hermodarchaeota archaeon]
MIRIDDIKFNENYYNLLVDYLINATGLNLNYYRKNHIEKRIKSRMIRVNCNTFESYYNYLLEKPSETKNFLDCFNINYSVFFRNWEVFKQFEKIFLYSLYLKKDDIISDLEPNPERQYQRIQRNLSSHSKKPKKVSLNRIISQTSLYRKIWNGLDSEGTINIWSCPCANGEEPYSIAMILDNLKKQTPGFSKYRIIASDIDGDAIKRAKIGVYKEDSTKDVSKYYDDNYFVKKKENCGFIYSINKKIQDSIEFIEEDVTKGHQTSLKYDIIFCRYLLIYISRKIRKVFLNIIESRLNPGGLLILGKTESLLNSQCDLKLIDTSNCIYIKRGGLNLN